jgi:tetratricopeptide (TPR) repeat protein
LEKTRIYYTATLQGPEAQPAFFRDGTPFNPLATLDGIPISNGAKIPLGHHVFSITTPKTLLFSTNLSIWYGPHDLGVISLSRAKAILEVTATPPARILSIRGPEYNIDLTNSLGTNLSLPTDRYTVTAQYPHWTETHQTEVSGAFPGLVQILPKFGTLELTCNQQGASFQLSRIDGTLVQTGELPITITDLPADGYQLTSWHHNHQWKQYPLVKAKQTNAYEIDFQYGTVVLESTPPGATVTSSEGREWGTTPLTITELQPGAMKFDLRLFNYEPASLSLDIAANQTNSGHATLISQSYAGAMRAARQSMNAEAYEDAARSLADALRAQPNDAAAAALLRQATGLQSMARASALANQGDYIAGIKELDKALADLPDNDRAKQMLTDFKQHAPEQLARQERENGEALTNIFDSVTSRITNATSVEIHALTTSKPVHDAQTAIVDKFTILAPAFKLDHTGWTNDIFYLDGDQEISGGGRICMMAGGPIKDGETLILFKVIEYKSEAVGFKILGTVLAAATKSTYQSSYHFIDPTDPKLSESDRTRVAEGTRIVTERIQHAIGESSAPGAPTAANK